MAYNRQAEKRIYQTALDEATEQAEMAEQRAVDYIAKTENEAEGTRLYSALIELAEFERTVRDDYIAAAAALAKLL